MVKDWDYFWGVDSTSAIPSQKPKLHAFMIIEKKDLVASKVTMLLAKYEFDF